MDDADRKIVAFLQEDGRASLAEIAAVAGLSVSAVNDRIKKLVQHGVIRGWQAVLAPAALGLDLLAFVQVLLDRPAHSSGFLAALIEVPEVQECHHITGDWSYLLKIRTSTTSALERLLAERIKVLQGVIRTHTVIALSSPKETGRLPVLPT